MKQKSGDFYNYLTLFRKKGPNFNKKVPTCPMQISHLSDTLQLDNRLEKCLCRENSLSLVAKFVMYNEI